MFYLIAIGITALALAGYFLFAKLNINNKKINLFKVFSIALFAIFSVRYFTYNSVLDNTTLFPNPNLALDKLPVDGRVWGLIALLVEWLSLATVTLFAVRPFFSIKGMDKLTLLISPVYSILAMVGLNAVIVNSIGGSADKLGVAPVIFSVEVGFTLALTIISWAKAIKHKNLPFPKGKEWAFFFLCLVLLIIVSTPNFAHKFLFGPSRSNTYNAKGIRILHRLAIYGAVIIPIGAYFALRKLPKSTVKCVLIVFSIIAMFIYCYGINFNKLATDPTSWPLHLCNTAMFLVPLCLVFKTNKLFYFTYFINVFGAMIAMLMPNYETEQLLNASATIRFWYNHYVAFFMPLLLVALGEFERPTIKQFKFSVIGFVMYFAFALIMNVILRGFGHDADYFFLAGDHIASTLGNWAENIYEITAGFTIAGHEFIFRPLYQSLFFVVYVLLGLAMWFVYELFFTLTEAHGALTERRRKIKIDHLALMATLGERSIEEPMNANAGIKLELKHFSKKYATGKKYAVKDANLEVFGGEIFGFLGPNGAGKSTIIKSIVGIQPITEGAIEVCGYDCEKQPVQAKRVMGYVPDHYALYEKLTGREYINYIADIYDVSQKDRTERIERHIEMFELEGSIDAPIKTYSHGMKQKITIMAALVHEPKLWILDEPLTGLDPNSIHQVKECMKEHARKGNIVFFSSHIIDVVEKICDRITIIKKGTILDTRSVKEIESKGSLEEYYLKMINGGDDR